jgi:hypothetical protein
VRIRKEGGHAVQAAERQKGLLKSHLPLTVDEERRVRWERIREESANSLAAALRDRVPSSGAPPHSIPVIQGS